MNASLRNVLAVVGCMFLCMEAQADQVLNAHYEINVTDKGSTNSVQSTFRLKPGATESLDLYPNTIQLSVQPISGDEYDLSVLVVPRQQSASAAVFNQKFRGRFGVPLELDARDGSLRVDGAISVVVLDDKGV
jgi:hypothetical protein